MFGANERVGKSFFSATPEGKEGKLLITSIFYTLQGEGRFAGTPAVFVRTAKCHLACSFCLPSYTPVNYRPQNLGGGHGESLRGALIDVLPGSLIQDRDKDGNPTWTPVLSNQVLEVPLTDLVLLSITRPGASAGTPLLAHKDHQILTEGGTWATVSTDEVKGAKIAHFGTRVTGRNMKLLPKTQAVRTMRTRENLVAVRNVEFDDPNMKISAIKTESGQYETMDVVHHNCDTFFDEGQWMTVDEVLAKVKEAHAGAGRKPIIVITGGEPLLQSENLFPLVAQLANGEYQVTFETTGTHPPLDLKFQRGNWVHYTLSPKIVKTGKGHSRIHPAWTAYPFYDLKFVVSATDPDYADTPEWLNHHWHLMGAGQRVYVSPMNCYKQGVHQIKVLDARLKGEVDGPVLSQWNQDGPLDTEANRRNHSYAAALCKKHGYTLSLQTHLFTELP